MYPVSANHKSCDEQTMDALDHLRFHHGLAYQAVVKHHPQDIIWDGGNFDLETMGVNEHWGNDLYEAIIATGLIFWEQEPYAIEDGDFEDNNEEQSLPWCLDARPDSGKLTTTPFLLG